MISKTYREQNDSFRKSEIVSRTHKQDKPRLHLNLKPLRAFFYVALLGAVIYFTIFSNTFKIKRVETEGIKSVEISDYLNQTLLGKNIIFFLPGSYLKTLSDRFPILEQAKIVRGLPSTVKVIISERSQTMIWCTDVCYNIDSRGYAYQQIPKPTTKAFISDTSGFKLEQGSQVTSPSFIDFFLSSIDRMNQMNLKVSEAKIEQTTFKVSFLTQGGFQVILDSSGSLDNQMIALKQVLDKNKTDIKEYVDLRVEGAAYIK